ncbi:hypothetical protein ACHAW6_004216 [Cyclotella cf. meneghiniana]
MTKQLQGSNFERLVLKNEWPQQEASASTQHKSLTKPKRVKFSKYSTRRVYMSDEYYEEEKSYSSVDQKIFRNQAINAALEIKRLISSCNLPAGLAVQQLMKQGLLTREELLGIEHLIRDNTERAWQMRQTYRKLVLDMQAQLRKENDTEVNDGELAAVAIANSCRMIEKARLRAALAL